MPSDMVLLCANDYAQDGAVVLLPDGGVVLKLDSEDMQELVAFLHQFEVTKHLRVHNRTYEVDTTFSPPNHVVDEETSNTVEEAFTNTATRYFNSNRVYSSHVLGHMFSSTC